MLSQDVNKKVLRVQFKMNNEVKAKRYVNNGQALNDRMLTYADVAGGAYNNHYYYTMTFADNFNAKTIVSADKDVAMTFAAKDHFSISNAGDFATFAAAVNAGQNAMDAKITDSIDFAEYSKTTEWAPLQNYAGTLDGQSHIITNFNANQQEGKRDALIATLAKGGVLQNLTLGAGCLVFKQHDQLGMFVNKNYGTIRKCVTEGCKNESGNYGDQGMIAGHNYAGALIEDCAVIGGQINDRHGKTHIALSGIVGTNEKDATVKNCIVHQLYIKKDTQPTSGSSLICANNQGTIENCFTNQKFGGNNKDDNYLKSNADFANGAVLSEFGASWGQQLGKDAKPGFNRKERNGTR